MADERRRRAARGGGCDQERARVVPLRQEEGLQQQKQPRDVRGGEGGLRR